MSKVLFGTLTFAALMTILLAKVFSQLAFAGELPRGFNPASLAGRGQYLGEYRVQHVYAHEKYTPKGDLCAIHDESQGYPFYRCGQTVLAYQHAGKIALIFAPDQDALGTDNLMVFAIEGKACATNGSLSEAAAKGIFNLGLCTVSQQALGSEQVSSEHPVDKTDAAMTIATGTFLTMGPSSTIVDISPDASEITVREMQQQRVLWARVNEDKTSILLPVRR